MEKNEGGQLVRALGLKESISMTIGTVVGVGLFTCGSSQIGYVGSGIIVITFLSLLIKLPTRPLLSSQIGDLLCRARRAGAIAQPMPAGHAARGENLLLMRRGGKRIPLRCLRVEQLLQLSKLPAGKAFV